MTEPGLESHSEKGQETNPGSLILLEETGGKRMILEISVNINVVTGMLQEKSPHTFPSLGLWLAVTLYQELSQFIHALTHSSTTY